MTNKKIALLLFAISITFVTELIAQTTVSGDVSGVWNSEGNPYQVVADIQVPPGDSLLIQAGVLVVFHGEYDFNVYGSLSLMGNPQDSILIAKHGNLDWGKLEIHPDAEIEMYYTYITSFKDGIIVHCADAVFDNCSIISGSIDYDNFAIMFTPDALAGRLNDCYIEATDLTSSVNLAEAMTTAFIGGNGIDISNCHFYSYAYANVQPPVSQPPTAFAYGLADFSGTITDSYIEVKAAVVGLAPWGNENCVARAFSGGSGTINGNSISVTALNYYSEPYAIVDFSGTVSYNLITVSENGIGWAAENIIQMTGDFYHNTVVVLTPPGSYLMTGPCCAWNNIFYCEDSSSTSALSNYVTPSYNCYYNLNPGVTGIGDIQANPMFVNPQLDDFHLQWGSPCIDAGDPASPLDPDSTIADIGAFYFDQLLGVEAPKVKIVPSVYTLSPSYPNPFNSSAGFSFSLPENTFVNILVYDLLGREAATIFKGHKSAGVYEMHIDGSNIASGIYFLRMETPEFESTQKMILLK